MMLPHRRIILLSWLEIFRKLGVTRRMIIPLLVNLLRDTGRRQKQIQTPSIHLRFR